MAQDNSNRRSRRSSKKTKRRNTQNNDQNGATFTKKDRTNTLPKLGADTMERVPSNAPTMAIAPSDYEHIFHEGPVVSPETKHEAAPVAPRSPTPPPVTLPRLTLQAPRSPAYQPTSPPPQPQQAYPNVHAQDFDAYGQESYGQERQITGNVYPPEVVVTPDGYTILGHAPAPRRAPLPPHIVRASNQFSRAALARVARYLATRAEPQFR